MIQQRSILATITMTIIFAPILLWDTGNGNGNTYYYSTSAYSIRGGRPYMEDKHYASTNGRLCAVFDGHGGSAVSRYARSHLLP
jgi:hypothetical protein